MATKVFSGKSLKGEAKRVKKSVSVDDRIIELYKALGYQRKDAVRQLHFITMKSQMRFV